MLLVFDDLLLKGIISCSAPPCTTEHTHQDCVTHYHHSPGHADRFSNSFSIRLWTFAYKQSQNYEF